MRKVQLVLRLFFAANMSIRAIARGRGVVIDDWRLRASGARRWARLVAARGHA